jgi:hypothetical protein
MSLLCRLKNLVRKGELEEKDLKRIVIIPKDVTNGDLDKQRIKTLMLAIDNSIPLPKGHGRLEVDDDSWMDIPVEEMSESQLRCAVKELRKKIGGE